MRRELDELAANQMDRDERGEPAHGVVRDDA